MAISEAGWTVDLLVLPFGEDKAIKGVSIERVPNVFGVKNISIGPSLLKACFDVLLFIKAVRLQKNNSYQVIHCVEDAGLIGLFIARMTGADFVFEKHSDPSSYKKGFLRNIVMKIYGAVERTCVKGADAVICTGSGLAQQAAGYGGKGRVYDICDIPSSLVEADPAQVSKIRSEWLCDSEAVVAAYVGSFAVYQGVDLLFESFVRAAQQNSDLKLVVVGGSRGEISSRSRWLRERGCLDRVIFQGHVDPDALASYLKAADILVSPRLSGVNTPLKLLDYLKSGRAILASDTSANRLILDPETACFADPDPASMGRGLLELASDHTKRITLGCNGRKLIDSKYNYQAFRNMIAQVYKKLDTRHAD